MRLSAIKGYNEKQAMSTTQSLNTNLHNAKANKKDEFYTQLCDIEEELQHYKQHFAGKVVYCNCDDPKISNFFHYFSYNFETLGLRRLITTCYKSQTWDLFSTHSDEKAVYLEYTGLSGSQAGDRSPLPDWQAGVRTSNQNRIPDNEEIDVLHLRGDGDFRSEECIALLKQADIVVTNPPFSLFREYVGQLIEYEKKFLIIGNKNAITYKEVFKFIKDNKLWVGNTPMGTDMLFDVPQEVSDTLRANKKEGSGYKIVDGAVKARAQAIWFTNLDIKKRHEDLILYRTYNPQAYPTYDNYDAIEISKTKDIPMDYTSVMGVPITFLDKYNPEQFEIVGMDRPLIEKITGKVSRFRINGKEIYARIAIKNKRV